MKISNLEAWVREKEGMPALTRENIENLQLIRLNELLSKEKQRGGFYADMPESVAGLGEIKKLPFTTSAQLSSQGGRMLILSQSDIVRVLSDTTSGTTGEAKRVFYGEKDCKNTIGFFAAGLSELVYPGDKVMICMPYTGRLGLGELISSAIKNLGAVPLEVGIGRSFGELAGILEEEQPQDFVGMPIPLLSLLRFCGKKSLLRALVSGDSCPHSVISETEHFLGTKLFPHYGSREMCLGGAVTCPAHEGMHLRENHIIAEIVDEDGNVLPDGEFGELVITTIGMQAMPLIRYCTGDRTRILNEICPCGCTLKRLDSLFRLPDERDLSALDNAIFRLRGLIDYHAEKIDNSLYISVLTNGSTESQNIRPLAEKLYPKMEINVTGRRCISSDKPMYIGKRRID